MPAALLAFASFLTFAAHPFAAPGVTSLTNKSVRYTMPKAHHVELSRGDVTAIIIDNEAGDAPKLTGHRAGYNGVASLTHARRRENLFVPAVAGLNFEHIHDGRAEPVRQLKFAPRVAPMQLRVVDRHTVELHQAPVAPWHLESCGRYALLADGTIEYTFECIPRADVFQNGSIGLFWASYIHEPEETAIHFRGRLADRPDAKGDWLRAVTPRHGVDATHPPAGPLFEPKLDPDFPLALIPHRSPYVHTDAWYYGVSHGMALVFVFRERDRIWFAQSPSGGGAKNPAWDWQWFIPDYQVDEAYGFVMRAAYVPDDGRESLRALAERLGDFDPLSSAVPKP